MAIMRLDKFFSSQEILSRKDIKTAIRHGAVAINGIPAKNVDIKVNTDSDIVSLNGKEIKYKPFVYIMLNKPKGVVSATDDKINKTVLDLVPDQLKRNDLFPAGRLDKDSEGFVLITNDGDFAHKILSPKKHVPKKYVVELDGRVTKDIIKAMRDGVTLSDGSLCKSADVKLLNDNAESTVEIVLSEGKYHQIKRMFGLFDLGVNSLKRISIGGLELDENLAPGKCREMLHKEVEKILGK